MKRLLVTVAASCLLTAAHGQEGRPALAAETAEDERVKKLLQKAFPHELPDWEVSDESVTDGITWFHNSGTAVSSPFSHEYRISYKRKNVTEAEKDQWRKIAVDIAGFQRMQDETECEINVTVNGFSTTLETDGKATLQPMAGMDLALTGPHESRLMMGGGWKLVRTETLDDRRKIYTLEAPLMRTGPMNRIQTVMIELKGAPSLVNYFVKNTDVAALRALAGQQKMQASPAGTARATNEKPLVKPMAGLNEIEFTLDGGDFQNRHIRLKHSQDNQFGYLRNNHPDPAITENAVTRILIGEDADFKTYNKQGFLDITIPFIRQTGSFEVYPGIGTATFAGGINCWNGCEYSFDADGLKVSVTRYDPVGGFIEGTFSGDVKVVYKAHESIETDRHKRPAARIQGRFKVRRQKDRY